MVAKAQSLRIAGQGAGMALVLAVELWTLRQRRKALASEIDE